ncbi:protein kinase [Streptomyces sp. AN091965]|nr:MULTISPECIES: protein kinase [unclassified Streptomyces]MCI3930181.1 protein kinase [Streptomyces sp. AN091965]
MPAPVAHLLQAESSTLVLHRRGSTVWHVRTSLAEYAVKLGYPITATDEWEAAEWPALAPAREGAVLQELGCDVAVYGKWERGTWNVQPWHDGVSLQVLWTSLRSRERVVAPPARDALACARVLATLHDKGYVHGDVQPAHFIVRQDPVQAVLIDLALARGAEIPQRVDFPYRGCLVHYESPEIARQVLEYGEAEPTQSADVYALGASLFMAATGWRHVEYPDDAPRAVQRQAVALGPHRPVNVAGALGRLIVDMLRPVSEDRPTVHEVCKALEEAPA